MYVYTLLYTYGHVHKITFILLVIPYEYHEAYCRIANIRKMLQILMSICTLVSEGTNKYPRVGFLYFHNFQYTPTMQDI